MTADRLALCYKHGAVRNWLTSCFDFDELHARIFWPTSMHAIPKVTKPCRYHVRMNLLDSRVVVACCHGFASHRDPIRVAVVLERQAYDAAFTLELLELLRVRIGQEEEVRPLGRRVERLAGVSVEGSI